MGKLTILFNKKKKQTRPLDSKNSITELKKNYLETKNI